MVGVSTARSVMCGGGEGGAGDGFSCQENRWDRERSDMATFPVSRVGGGTVVVGVERIVGSGGEVRAPATSDARGCLLGQGEPQGRGGGAWSARRAGHVTQRVSDAGIGSRFEIERCAGRAVATTGAWRQEMGCAEHENRRKECRVLASLDQGECWAGLSAGQGRHGSSAAGHRKVVLKTGSGAGKPRMGTDAPCR